MNWDSWGDAARFCNWLQNGQPTGAEGAGTTETGSYTLNGATTTAGLFGITHNAGSTYWIPTENEWYKSAYYAGGGTVSTANGTTDAAGYWFYPTQADNNGSDLPKSTLSTTGTNNANFNSVGLNSPNLWPLTRLATSPALQAITAPTIKAATSITSPRRRLPFPRIVSGRERAWR